MDILYARMNFQLEESECSQDKIREWIELLTDAVNMSGAEEHEIFFIEKEKIIGVSIPFENDVMVTLEVGADLGAVKSEMMNSDLKFESNWISIHDENDNLIESPI